MSYTCGMSSQVIALRCYTRYDHHDSTEKRTVVEETPAAIEQRLKAGVTLTPGEVGRLFGKSRWAVDYWLKNGARIRGADGKWQRFYIHFTETAGGHRLCDPQDVLRLLEATRQRRSGAPAPPAHETSPGVGTPPSEVGEAPVNPPSNGNAQVGSPSPVGDDTAKPANKRRADTPKGSARKR